MCPSNEKMTNNRNQFGMAHMSLLYREDPRTAICLQRQYRRRNSAAIPPDGDTSPNIIEISNSTDIHQRCSVAAPAKSCPSNASNARFCNLYKSRKTKSTLFLIIFFCAIVLQKSSAIPVTSSGQRLILHTSQYRQRHHQQLLDQWGQAPPPTQPHHRHHLHHRSVSNMQETEQIINSDTCKTIRGLQRLANITYNTIREGFNSYTLLQFNNQSDKVLREWSRHSLQLKHPLTEVLVRNFTQMPDKTLFENLIDERLSSESIAEEMRKVYTALSALKFAFTRVTEDRKRNKAQLLHDLNNNREIFNEINKFMDSALIYINNNLQETQDAMEKLNIPLPEVKDPEDEFHPIPKVRDLLLASEHLSVIQHLRALYMFLLKKCDDEAAM